MVGDDFIKIYKRDTNTLVNTDKTLSQGQCIMGVRRIFVGVEGTYYPCEKVNDAIIIGDAKNGLNPDIVYTIMKNYNEMHTELCQSCWAIRLCMKCYKSLLDGKTLCHKKLKADCELNIQYYPKRIIAALELLEKRSDVFGKFDHIIFS